MLTNAHNIIYIIYIKYMLYIYINSWKSKTKQRMVFLDDPRKGFPTTKGQRVVFGLPGYGKPQKDSLQNKKRWFSSMDIAVCTYSRLHRGRNQSWKCNADNETTSSSLLHGCSIFGKGCKGQTKNYMERCLHVGAYTHTYPIILMSQRTS